ncbi:GFA family protein [Parerythrobacter jejuensis]|uniref:GFA family protein n=1 Tax=Parerythrobacter jejuensis TaxID=795812 RepID=A0A845ARJ4_9SPHN|nr:GFA family protein [Parerythrobacter jejuensis]MXP30732.1 GFA family protein [Parerythrobacter jejuensis]MXP33492.1 GFA family protein [Parerythrobacter jejuensis]
MSHDAQSHGSCLCGGVKVTLPKKLTDVGVCHCDMCRRWTSGPWMALQCPNATIEGETLTIFKSSSFAERGFCRACGSAIFHRPIGGQELAISAGLFDQSDFVIEREIFFERKPPYYRFEAESEKKTSLALAFEWGPKLLWRQLKRIAGR